MYKLNLKNELINNRKNRISMKRISLFIVVTAFTGLLLNGQETQPVKEEFKPSGKATGKIFWNYNYNLTEDANQKSSFRLDRVYFGYNYNFSEKATAVIIIDGAKKSDASEYTVFVKNAYLDYKVNDMILLSGGMIELKQVDTQDKFWKYRYLFKPFQDEFKLGTTADLGVNGEFKLMPDLKVNLFVINGEGFTKLQDEFGLLKFGTSILFEPVEGLILKAYYDIYGGKARVNDTVIDENAPYIQSYDFWAGYKTDKYRIGAGFSYKINTEDFSTIAEDQDLLGLYANGAYALNNKFELFGMWFKYKSNKLSGATETWNNEADGNVLLGGIQYSPVKGVKTALNYRTYIYDNSAFDTKSYIFLNFEFAF